MVAVPFLLPLMLQLGFGFSAFHSVLVIFIVAFGSLATKFAARRVFARHGFKNTLIVAALFAALGTAINFFFYPETPYLVLVTVLALTGFARSFYITGINILGFADIDHGDTSKATALNSVIQKISGAVGVAFAGIVLEIHALVTGQSLGLASFHIAFIAVAVVNLVAIVPLLGLRPGSGSGVSGHPRRVVD